MLRGTVLPTLHKETPEFFDKNHKNILAIIQIYAPVGNRHCISQSSIKISRIMFAQISLAAPHDCLAFFQKKFFFLKKESC